MSGSILVYVDILRLRDYDLKPMYLIPYKPQWRLYHQMLPMCGQDSRMLGYCGVMPSFH